MSAPVIASFGGGVNSTAMLVEWVRLGRALDLVLFADTGGELPETYAHVERFSSWLVERGAPPVTLVRARTRDGEALTLEAHSLKHRMLPSLAYGFRSCSVKFKHEPQEKHVNHWQPAVEAWAHDERVTKLIGFHAGESHRADRAPSEDKKYRYQYPLIEWGWGPDECIDAIRAAGLHSVGKSSCFFCPAMKRHEIVRLRESHPEQFARALALEANAELDSVKGLGRRFAWADIDKTEAAQLRLFELETPCGCYDGDAEVVARAGER
jgi:hypothetical protein